MSEQEHHFLTEAQSHRAQELEELSRVTGAIVDASVRIHKKLGPGLLESVYELVLARDLTQRGFSVERQKPISFEYEGILFENAFTLDLLVNNSVIVEIKSVSKLAPVHEKQILTYLRLLNRRLGLLMNFGEPIMKSGIQRVINGH